MYRSDLSEPQWIKEGQLLRVCRLNALRLGVELWMKSQRIEEGDEGSATMADGEFRLEVEFGHGLFEVGQVEEGVVAEAFCAAWDGEDFAFDCAVGGAEDVSVAGGGEDTAVAGMMWTRNLVESAEQAEVVSLVWTGIGRRGEVFVFGVAGGANAGSAVEGVDLEAGVVGKDDFAGGVEGVIDGFEPGVAFEGGFVFGGGGDLFYAGEGRKGDSWS